MLYTSTYTNSIFLFRRILFACVCVYVDPVSNVLSRDPMMLFHFVYFHGWCGFFSRFFSICFILFSLRQAISLNVQFYIKFLLFFLDMEQNEVLHSIWKLYPQYEEKKKRKEESKFFYLAIEYLHIYMASALWWAFILFFATVEYI